MPLTLALFLVVGAIASSGYLLGKTGVIEERGILGTPPPPAPFVSSAEGAEVDQIAVLDAAPHGAFVSSNGTEADYSETPSLADTASLGNATLKDMGEPVGPAFDRSGMTTYKVQSGDTLSAIASYFGISVGTIASANPGVAANKLQIGEALNILPTSGVVYEAESGDNLETISNAFDIPADKITQFNPSVNFGALGVGTPIIIPGGNINNRLAGNSALPNFDSEFVMPANGYDWGILHNDNAVDIANSCGTPVVAAADGLVIPDDQIPDVTGGWNGGYGNFVLLEHAFGNGVRTRYAYLESVSVQVGDYVTQGQVIGLMGQSGEATGCAVHFGVIGAHNPFAKS
jgi:murein DD-endopeptidase MepM/ murein hydrolase activator NlpD